MSARSSDLSSPPVLRDFAPAVGKALHSKTWLERCILTGVGVRYRSARKSKWKSQLEGFMPIILSVDHERKEVDATAVAPISYSDVENHLLAERHFGGLAYKEFIDARCAGILLTSVEIRKIVALLRSLGQESKLGPTAVLVSTDVAFGLMRMLQMFVDDVCEIRPFRDEQEARAWLATKSTGS